MWISLTAFMRFAGTLVLKQSSRLQVCRIILFAILILFTITPVSLNSTSVQAQTVCPPENCTAGKNVDRAFFQEVIKQLTPKTEVTDFAVDALMLWKPKENTNACWNPMATTQPMQGACNFNSVGVKHYLTREDGIAATAITLNNGYYDSIKQMLRGEKFDKEAIRKSLKTWGTCTQPTCVLLDEWEELWKNMQTEPQITITPEIQIVIPDVPENAIVIDEDTNQFSKIVGGQLWQDSPGGYANHFFWRKISDGECKGRWMLYVDDPGSYKIYAYVPAIHSTIDNVTYSIRHGSATDIVQTSQNKHQNEWLYLGMFRFDSKEEEYIELSSLPEEQNSAVEVAFDAVAYVYQEPGAIEIKIDEIVQQIKNWIETTVNNLIQQIRNWLREIENNALQQFKEWLQEFSQLILLEIRNLINELLQQCCGSIYLFIVVPALPLILRKKMAR